MKILFITATRIGDAVLSTGLLDYMRSSWPEARVSVACGQLSASLFEGFANVEKIIPMNKRKRSGHWVDLWKEVAGTRWDIVVDLRNSAVSRLIWARKRYVFGHHIDRDLHKVEQAAQIMKLTSVPAPRLFFTPAQEAFADALMGPRQDDDGGGEGEGRAFAMGKGFTIGVAPSANWIGKTWPAENFIAVLEFLRGPQGLIPQARVAVLAAPGEEAQARPVLESIPETHRIDGIAKGNPGEVAAALARCDFFIGNDSGLMHAAAAAGVPTLGLFGPSYPHLYAPWGDHAAYVQTPQTYDELIDYEGYNSSTLTQSLMGELTPEKVIDVLTRFDPLMSKVGAALIR